MFSTRRAFLIVAALAALLSSGCASALGGGGGGGGTLWSQVPSGGLVFFSPGSKSVNIVLQAASAGSATISAISVPAHYTRAVVAPTDAFGNPKPLPITLTPGQSITISVTAQTGATFGHMTMTTSAGSVSTTLDPRF